MMDELSSGSSDYAANSWVAWFLSTKGNEYFCEVDEDYILDRFNLTGLNAEVQHYPQALDLVTDALEEELDEESREHVENQARLLYGLVHARYIITTRGLAKMLEKYKRADFGRCPRVLCYQQALLPVGLSDVPFQKAVKLFCPRCEDIYSPKSSRHGTIDGAFFGSTFPHMLFMVYPHMLPSKSPTSPSAFLLSQTTGAAAAAAARAAGSSAHNADGLSSTPGEDGVSTLSPSAQLGAASSGAGAGPAGAPGGSTANAASKVERYRPRIFGFPTHETAKLHRWQERQRDAQIERLERAEQTLAAAAAAAMAGGGNGVVAQPGAGVAAGTPAVGGAAGMAGLD